MKSKPKTALLIYAAGFLLAISPASARAVDPIVPAALPSPALLLDEERPRYVVEEIAAAAEARYVHAAAGAAVPPRLRRKLEKAGFGAYIARIEFAGALVLAVADLAMPLRYSCSYGVHIRFGWPTADHSPAIFRRTIGLLLRTARAVELSLSRFASEAA